MTRDELIELLRRRRQNDVMVRMVVDNDAQETGNPDLRETHRVNVVSVDYDTDYDSIVIVTEDAFGRAWGNSSTPDQKRELAADLLRSANEDEGYWVQ